MRPPPHMHQLQRAAAGSHNCCSRGQRLQQRQKQRCGQSHAGSAEKAAPARPAQQFTVRLASAHCLSMQRTWCSPYCKARRHCRKRAGDAYIYATALLCHMRAVFAAYGDDRCTATLLLYCRCMCRPIRWSSTGWRCAETTKHRRRSSSLPSLSCPRFCYTSACAKCCPRTKPKLKHRWVKWQMWSS